MSVFIDQVAREAELSDLPAYRLADVASRTAVLHSWLSDHQKQHARTPLDAAAAFLFGTLTWNLLEDLARRWLEAGAGPWLDTDAIAVCLQWQHWVHEGAEGDHPQFVYFEAWRLENKPVDSAGLQQIADDLHLIFTPLVGRLSQLAGIPASALWRVLGDSISGAFLEVGEPLGLTELAIERANALLAACQPPVRNKQIAYFSLTLAAERTCRRQPYTRWFRRRGGCCRYYKVEGGEYCTTCVLRDEASRDRLLLDSMQRTLDTQ